MSSTLKPTGGKRHIGVQQDRSSTPQKLLKSGQQQSLADEQSSAKAQLPPVEVQTPSPAKRPLTTANGQSSRTEGQPPPSKNHRPSTTTSAGSPILL